METGSFSGRDQKFFRYTRGLHCIDSQSGSQMPTKRAYFQRSQVDAVIWKT